MYHRLFRGSLGAQSVPGHTDRVAYCGGLFISAGNKPNGRLQTFGDCRGVFDSNKEKLQQSCSVAGYEGCCRKLAIYHVRAFLTIWAASLQSSVILPNSPAEM